MKLLLLQKFTSFSAKPIRRMSAWRMHERKKAPDTQTCHFDEWKRVLNKIHNYKNDEMIVRFWTKFECNLNAVFRKIVTGGGERRESVSVCTRPVFLQDWLNRPSAFPTCESILSFCGRQNHRLTVHVKSKRTVKLQ